MTNPNLYIIDDGTLDTVVACAACDWEGRYNPECPGCAECDSGGDNLDGDRPTWRTDAALEMAADDHDCGEPEGSLN